MIDWLNDNSGAVEAFAVCTLVIITAVYAGFTWRMVREMREQRLAQDRPDLLVDVLNLEDLEWHEPTGEDEQSEANPWLHTYPKTLACRVHNAGHHVAKEVAVTVLHPGAIFQSSTKGFVCAGETWHTTVSVASKLAQYLSETKPKGLSKWLEDWGHSSSTPSSYDAGVVVNCRDIHDTRWVTYLVVGLIESQDIQGKVTDRQMVLAGQRLFKPKNG